MCTTSATVLEALSGICNRIWQPDSHHWHAVVWHTPLFAVLALRIGIQLGFFENNLSMVTRPSSLWVSLCVPQ
jgi:hypothetical protein